MFQSTITESFESWDNFLHAYYEPIRTALRLIPYVGENRADDLTQSFFLKMYEQGILEKRPAITGKFRNWLYVAARRHAVDEWRKAQRRPERSAAAGDPEPIDAGFGGAEGPPWGADEFYALSILHMTVAHVHKHLLDEGKSEHWMIFDELVLAPLMPGRVPVSRQALLAMFPGQSPGFLDNRVTTVKRIFRRMLPALVPADPTDALTPDERFDELLEILQASKTSRLWLAFLAKPTPSQDESTGSSLDLAVPASALEPPDENVPPEVLNDELRVLLGFWLEMPLSAYLDDLEMAGPTIAQAVRDARPRASLRRASGVAPHLNLLRLIDATLPLIASIPQTELINLLEQLKSYAKRVHRLAKQAKETAPAQASVRRHTSMPVELAQVLYDLAGALALTRCGSRIIGISDDRYRKNIQWLLSQPWLDTRLRPVFFAVLTQLSGERSEPDRPHEHY